MDWRTARPETPGNTRSLPVVPYSELEEHPELSPVSGQTRVRPLGYSDTSNITVEEDEDVGVAASLFEP